MSATVLTLHVGESLRSAYAAALEGAAELVIGPVGGLSSRFEELAEAPMIEIARSLAPSWTPGEPLVVVGYSAGCFAIRRWLNEDAGAQELTPLAVVLLDGLHGGGGPACFPVAIRGVIDFAVAATEDPRSRLLVNTTTDIVPPYSSTTACAQKLLYEVGKHAEITLTKPDEGQAPGLHVLDYGGTAAEDHARQVREVGPAVLHEYVVPWLRQQGSSRAMFAPLFVVLGMAAAGYYVATRTPRRKRAA